jgi:hypothetical protein
MWEVPEAVAAGEASPAAAATVTTGRWGGRPARRRPRRRGHRPPDRETGRPPRPGRARSRGRARGRFRRSSLDLSTCRSSTSLSAPATATAAKVPSRAGSSRVPRCRRPRGGIHCRRSGGTDRATARRGTRVIPKQFGTSGDGRQPMGESAGGDAGDPRCQPVTTAARTSRPDSHGSSPTRPARSTPVPTVRPTPGSRRSRGGGPETPKRRPSGVGP